MMIVFGWMFESVFLESWGLSVRGIDDYEVPPQSLDGLNTQVSWGRFFALQSGIAERL